MLVIPLGLIAVIISFVMYLHYKKADRMTALKRIERRLEQIAREERDRQEGVPVPVPVHTGRFSRRR